MEYRYQAWSRTSGERRGSVRAGSAAEAKRLIEDDDTLVLEVAEERRRSFVSRELRLKRASVRKSDVAWLARQLATTERAGIPIKRALETIAAQRPSTAIAELTLDIARRLAEGDDLAEAFAAHDIQLGAVTTALVAAGVAGGTLGVMFAKLATMTEKQVELRRKIRGALTYPSVVLVLSLLMTTAMLLFVVPTFRGLYAQLNGRLPLPTRVLVTASNQLRERFWLMPVALIGGILAYRAWSANEDHALRVDTAKMRIPIVGRLLTSAAVARVAGTLGGLLDAGVSTLAALNMAAAAAGLRPIEANLRRIAEEVRDGRSFTAALASSGTWPDVMVQLARVGEESGQLADLLNRYAEISQDEVSAQVERVVNLIEPLMVVVIGGIVGVMVVCLYLPLFDLVNLIK